MIIEEKVEREAMVPQPAQIQHKLYESRDLSYSSVFPEPNANNVWCSVGAW